MPDKKKDSWEDDGWAPAGEAKPRDQKKDTKKKDSWEDDGWAPAGEAKPVKKKDSWEDDGWAPVGEAKPAKKKDSWEKDGWTAVGEAKPSSKKGKVVDEDGWEVVGQDDGGWTPAGEHHSSKTVNPYGFFTEGRKKTPFEGGKMVWDDANCRWKLEGGEKPKSDRCRKIIKETLDCAMECQQTVMKSNQPTQTAGGGTPKGTDDWEPTGPIYEKSPSGNWVPMKEQPPAAGTSGGTPGAANDPFGNQPPPEDWSDGWEPAGTTEVTTTPGAGTSGAPGAAPTYSAATPAAPAAPAKPKKKHEPKPKRRLEPIRTTIHRPESQKKKLSDGWNPISKKVKNDDDSGSWEAVAEKSYVIPAKKKD